MFGHNDPYVSDYGALNAVDRLLQNPKPGTIHAQLPNDRSKPGREGPSGFQLLEGLC